MTSNDLSIIVVSHSCRDLLVACLESLAPDRHQLKTEVLLVDNGSNDGTTEVVRRRFPWVHVTEERDNRGFSWSNNVAISKATGSYLLLLNPDTIVPAGGLDSAVDALSEHPEVGMLGVKLVKPDGTLDHACKRSFPTPASSLAYFTGLARLSPKFADYMRADLDPDEAGLVDAVNGAFMLLRRSALEAVGLLDEDFWLYMEDLDWCYRFWQAGWPVLYWPGVEVVHVKGGSSGRHRSWRANLAFHRGMWLFYRKHYAATRPRLVTGLVWAGIWAKLAVSVTRSAVGRALASA